MKTKFCLTLVLFILYVGFAKGGVFAQSLPDFVYLGGDHAGNKVGDKVPSTPNNDPNLPRLVVKHYTPTGFTLMPISTKQVTLDGTEGCKGGAGKCFVDEVWKTNATVAPVLYTKGQSPAALVNVGWVNKLDASGNQCYFDYVLIDDDGTTSDREGFYITTDTWTKTTLPQNLTYCTTGYNPPNNGNPLIPVHCSTGPTATMVSEGSFEVPRSGNLYIVSKESIGYASTVSCRPVPPEPENKTDFEGFLWGINEDPTATTCKIDSTPAQRANCRLDENDLKNNVTLTFFAKSDSYPKTEIDTATYDRLVNPPKYDVDDLLLGDADDNPQVQVCVNLNQMTHPTDSPSGTYELKSTKMGNVSLGLDGTPKRCTGWFTPNNLDGNNNVHFGFSYTAIPSFDPPWYSTNNGDVFAGADVVNRDATMSQVVNPPFTNNIVTSGIGSVLGHGGVTPASKYSTQGARVTNMVNGPTWNLPSPAILNPPSSWNTTMPSGTTFEAKVYAVSFNQFNNWLNPATGTPPTTYSVVGNKLAVVYVNGSGGNTLNFSRNLVATGGSRLLIITNVPVNVTASTAFGQATIGVATTPNINAAIISNGGVSFITGGAQTDKSLLLQGIVATSGLDKSVVFGWDRGSANNYPATHVNFDPAYAWMVADLDLNAQHASGLTTFDLTWEVLD
jgi:hypothetical protein